MTEMKELFNMPLGVRGYDVGDYGSPEQDFELIEPINRIPICACISDKETAEAICQAVNTHDQMLTDIKRLMEVVGRFAEAWNTSPGINKDDPNELSRPMSYVYGRDFKNAAQTYQDIKQREYLGGDALKDYYVRDNK